MQRVSEKCFYFIGWLRERGEVIGEPEYKREMVTFEII